MLLLAISYPSPDLLGETSDARHITCCLARRWLWRRFSMESAVFSSSTQGPFKLELSESRRPRCRQWRGLWRTWFGGSSMSLSLPLYIQKFVVAFWASWWKNIAVGGDFGCNSWALTLRPFQNLDPCVRWRPGERRIGVGDDSKI